MDGDLYLWPPLSSSSQSVIDLSLFQLLLSHVWAALNNMQVVKNLYATGARCDDGNFGSWRRVTIWLSLISGSLMRVRWTSCLVSKDTVRVVGIGTVQWEGY